MRGELYGERELGELRAAAAGLMDAVCKGEEGRTEFDNDVEPGCDTASIANNEAGSGETSGAVECVQLN